MYNILVFFVCLLVVDLRTSSAAVSATTVDLKQQVKWLGRFQEKDGTFRSDWPYSGFRIRSIVPSEVLTSELVVDFGDDGCDAECGFYVEAIIDCEVTGKFHIIANTTLTIDFSGAINHSRSKSSDNLSGGQVVVSIELRKVTEASCDDANGIMQIKKLTLNNAHALAIEDLTPINSTSSDALCAATLAARRRHKLLVIGDSVSAAYGVDGDYPCDFSAELQNVHHGYATIVAEEIDAEVQVVAWSGKGAVRNYGDENQVSSNPMPTYYNRTLGNEAAPDSKDSLNYWNPSSFLADIILVMLGSNDYSTQPNPTDEQFTSGLSDFLNLIREDYSQAAAVVAACSPSAHGNQCANIQAAANQAGAVYLFIDPDCYDGGYGCDMHPNAVSQQFIADVVGPALKGLLQYP